MGSWRPAEAAAAEASRQKAVWNSSPLPARGPDLGSAALRGVPGLWLKAQLLLPLWGWSHLLAPGSLRSISCKPGSGAETAPAAPTQGRMPSQPPVFPSPSPRTCMVSSTRSSFSNHLPRACCVPGTKSGAKAPSFPNHAGVPLATKTGGSQGRLVWTSSSLSFGFSSGPCPPALISQHYAGD